jgi:hypothetical protein
MSAADEPWNIRATSVGRITGEAGQRIMVPPPHGFETHNAARLLKNLRDATAHGDARSVKPYNVGGRLVGFRFTCEERNRNEVSWSGEITLLKSDMHRIGEALAKLYCDAIRSDAARGVAHGFVEDARSIREVAA